MLNRHTRLLLLAGSLWCLGEGMLGPLFALFAERVGGSILDISWAWAINLIATGVCIVVVGKISDEVVSKELLMVAGYALNAAFTFGYLLVASPLGLFVVQAGLGVALALAVPTWDALYARYAGGEQSGLIWGLAGAGSNIVTGVAIVVGGLIVTHLSFTALFVAMGIIQTLATAYQAQILRR